MAKRLTAEEKAAAKAAKEAAKVVVDTTNASETVDTAIEQESSEQEFNDGLFEQETTTAESEPVATYEVIGSAVVVNEPARDMPKVRHPILVGCKLPHGLVLEHGGKKVTLQGLNRVQVIGAKHMVNYVPEDFWNAWKAANPRFPALVSGAIFEGRTNDEIKSKAREFSKRLTGFEKMKPEAMGVTKAEE